MPKFKHNPKLTTNAKRLRKEMTEEERKLWYTFLRTCPVRFLRQKVIGDYIVDFYCARAQLAIELDGSQHYEDDYIEADAARTKRLEQFDVKVIRIPNNYIHTNFKEVCEYIYKIVQERIEEIEESP